MRALALARYCLTASAPAWATWPSYCAVLPLAPIAPAILPPEMISTPPSIGGTRHDS
jgi:hypothetical protein